MADLAVTDKFSVNPKIEAGINALKIEKKITAEIILVKLEITDVDSARVVVGNIRRIAGIRIVGICVIRRIIALIKIHLPVHRHLDFVVITVNWIVGGIKSVLNVDYRIIESEIPFAVEKLKIL